MPELDFKITEAPAAANGLAPLMETAVETVAALA